MAEYIGVLTSGGDTPGLNAALRGIGKSAQNKYNMELIGFKDGFCKAFDYVIENARFHQSTYESIFNMFKEEI